MNELDEVRNRYDRRLLSPSTRYDPTRPENLLTNQYRQVAIVRALIRGNLLPLGGRRIIEVGCGNGKNLLELLQLGASPDCIVANELLEERVVAARLSLPEAVKVLDGDATSLQIETGSFDIVYQSTVFSSILDHDFQHKLANEMWRWVKPGGAVLWYDFTVNNPRNRDVVGISQSRVRELFPDAKIHGYRTTLAPPLARALGGFTLAHRLLASLPPLRTHWVAVLCKPADLHFETVP
jgi:SAM-dependent methyltransferase